MDIVGEVINRAFGFKVLNESQWSFKTSAGASMGVGTPVVKLGLNRGGGSMWIQKDGAAGLDRLDFGGVGASAGVSLSGTPINLSFSMRAMPSAGRIYRMPFAGRKLTKDELLGGFVMFEAAADFGAGGSQALMFIGGNPGIAMLAGLPGAGVGQIGGLVASSKACVRFGGMTVTAVPVNASINVYIGFIL